MNWKQWILTAVFSIPVIPIYLIGLPFYVLSGVSDKIWGGCQDIMYYYQGFIQRTFPGLKRRYDEWEEQRK